MAKADDGLHASPAPAERLASLRAELKRRGLDGFVVPRADEHQNEYLPRRSSGWPGSPASPARPALAIVLATRRRSSSTAAIRCRCATRSTPRLFEPRHPVEEPPDALDRRELTAGRQARLRPLAAHRRRAGALRARGRARPAAASCRSSRTRSTRCGATGRRRRSRRCCRTRSSSPARPASSASAPHRRHRRRQGRRRGGADRARFDRLAAQRARRRRAPHAAAAGLRDPARRRPVDLFIDRAQGRRPTVGLARQRGDRGAARRRCGAALDALGTRRQARAGRSGDRRRSGTSTRLQAAGATMRARRRPLRPAQGLQEPGRDRGHARRPSPRRRGADAASSPGWRARRRAAACRRDRGRRPAARRFREATGALKDLSLRHHRRRRPQRRHRPLPRRRRATERALEPGSLYLVDSGAPVPRRHHRRHPHRRHRRRRRRRCATASPWC